MTIGLMRGVFSLANPKNQLYNKGSVMAIGWGEIGDLNETHGTMHGFDIVQNAPTTKSALEERISFMKKWV